MYLYESYRFGANNEFTFIDCENFNYKSLHFHRSYEIVYVSSGEIEVTIDEKCIKLSSEEYLMIFPNQIHSYLTEKESKGFIVIFSPELISLFNHDFLNKLPREFIKKLSPAVNDFVINYLKADADIYIVKACLYAICSDLLSKTDFIDKDSKQDFSLQHKILSYIEKNYKRKISLYEIAKNTGYSYQYLSRFFNAQFKVPFPGLLNEYRINYAIYLIKNSDKNITDIAFECGFDNLRSFNRNFYKVMAMNPTEFKKSIKEVNG